MFITYRLLYLRLDDHVSVLSRADDARVHEDEDHEQPQEHDGPQDHQHDANGIDRVSRPGTHAQQGNKGIA